MPNVADLQKVKGLSFFSEVKSELSKVVWPSKDETIRLTGIVIIISLAVGIFVGGLDFVFTNLAGLIIR